MSISLLLISQDATSINLTCTFSESVSFGYICTLQRLNLVDDENQEFTFVGNHLPNRTNDDVMTVNFRSDHTPFVIRQTFRTFQNTREFSISHTGLNRIQENAFDGAVNLRNFRAFNNPLRFIGAHAFSEAKNMTRLDLARGLVEFIDQTAFEGLENLQVLILQQLQLSHLPANIFSTLTSLRALELNSNFITSIDGDIFGNNQQLALINLSENRINAIGQTFLDAFPRQNIFVILNVQVNRCTSRNFSIRNEQNIEETRTSLQRCFENYEKTQKKIY